MKDILTLIKAKKIQIFFLLFSLLFIPIISPISQNISFIEAIPTVGINLMLVFILFFIGAFMNTAVERIYYIVLLVVTLIPSVIYFAYLMFAQVLLTPHSLTAVFETNPSESKEFIANYLSLWVVGVVIVYIAIPIFLLVKMKFGGFNHLLKKWKYWLVLPFFMLISCICVPVLANSIGIISFYKVFITDKIKLKQEIKDLEKRANIDFNVSIIGNVAGQKNTFIVVVGESHGRNHMSLYNYYRNTNPKLEKFGEDLKIYKDVISPQVNTIPVIRSLFTLSENEESISFLNQPSLFELFNRAGFETYYITNQLFADAHQTSYEGLLNLAKHKYALAGKKRHDEVVFEPLLNVLSDNNTPCKFIVIHLIGSHTAYEFRYPEQFNVFNSGNRNANTLQLPDESLLMRDQYDNSVLYNDFVVDSIIKITKQNTTDAAVIYFSDHGEEVFDFRNFAGHAYEKVSRQMCEIPFLFWMSDEFGSNNSFRIEIDVNRPYSTLHFIHSISDLAGLNYEGFNSKYSLFSKDFVPTERKIDDYTYEQIIEKSK